MVATLNPYGDRRKAGRAWTKVCQIIRERDCGQCVYCAILGQETLSGSKMEVDHVIPWTDCTIESGVFGEYNLDNLVLSCRACNRRSWSTGNGRKGSYRKPEWVERKALAVAYERNRQK